MPAYLIVRVDMKDPVAYGEYMKHTPRILADHGGRFLARGGAAITLEGSKDDLRTVLIEFDSIEAAQAMYDSPEYQAAKQLREGAGDAHFLVVDGYPDAEWRAVVEESRRHVE